MNIGKVIEINERFIAVVVLPAIQMSVLKIVTPKNEVIKMYLQFFINSFQLSFKDFIAKGVKTITATVHLQKAKDIGGISEDRFLATIKFPDQIAVASRANKKPKKGLFELSFFN